MYLLTAEEALPGQSVNVYVAIFSKQDYNFYGLPIVTVDGLYFEGQYKSFSLEEYYSLYMTECGLVYEGSWKFTFTMPSKPVTVKSEAWVEQEYLGIPWHRDCSTQIAVALTPIPAEFANFAIEAYSIY